MLYKSFISVIPVIELTEDPNAITLLSNEILNGKVYKSAKLDNTPGEPVNSTMQLKICYQKEDNDIETEIVLSNENCTYKIPQYQESSSLSSLSSQASQVNSSSAWMKVQMSSDSCGYPTTFFEQFSTLLFRMTKQISRNRQGKTTSATRDQCLFTVAISGCGWVRCALVC